MSRNIPELDQLPNEVASFIDSISHGVGGDCYIQTACVKLYQWLKSQTTPNSSQLDEQEDTKDPRELRGQRDRPIDMLYISDHVKQLHEENKQHDYERAAAREMQRFQQEQIKALIHEANLYRDLWKRAEMNLTAVILDASKKANALKAIIQASQVLKDNPNCAYILKIAEEANK